MSLTADLEIIHNQHSQKPHRLLLSPGQTFARIRIQDKKAADVNVGFGSQRSAGIEPEVRVSLYKRERLVAVIFAQIVDDEEAILRRLPRRRRQCNG